jgi:hypothetical protein
MIASVFAVFQRNCFPLGLLAAVLLTGTPLKGQDAMPPAEEAEAVVVTAMGEFRFEFAPDKAPEHVRQFMARAQEGYYDGSAFFRVILNGIIQGGDPLLKDAATARQLWGTGGLKLLKSSFSDMKHERGVVSTVRIPDQPEFRWRAVLCLRFRAAGARWSVFSLWTGYRGHGCGGKDLAGAAGRRWIYRRARAYRTHPD